MEIVILKRDSAPGSSRPKTLLTGFLKMAQLQVCPLDPTKTVSRGQVINFDISTILGQVNVESPLDPTKTVKRGQVINFDILIRLGQGNC